LLRRWPMLLSGSISQYYLKIKDNYEIHSWISWIFFSSQIWIGTQDIRVKHSRIIHYNRAMTNYLYIKVFRATHTRYFTFTKPIIGFLFRSVESTPHVNEYMRNTMMSAEQKLSPIWKKTKSIVSSPSLLVYVQKSCLKLTQAYILTTNSSEASTVSRAIRRGR